MLQRLYPGQIIVVDLYPISQRCLCLIYTPTSFYHPIHPLPTDSSSIIDRNTNLFSDYLSTDDIDTVLREVKRYTQHPQHLKRLLYNSRGWFMWENHLHILADQRDILFIANNND